MRASIMVVATALLASVAATTRAALAPSPVEYGTPFGVARAELAKAGFVPARIVWRARRRDCGNGAKCWATGPVYCYVALGVCRWLFVNRANNALYFVDTSKLPRLDGSVPPGEYRDMWLATRGELEWHNIEIVLPNGVHRRFVPQAATAGAADSALQPGSAAHLTLLGQASGRRRNAQMRPFVVLVAVALLALAGTAHAGSAPPSIASGTPFASARADLAKAGFAPVGIVSPRDDCRGVACRRPRPVDCFRSRSVCVWLFANRTDNALYSVEVFVEQRRDGSVAHFFEGIGLPDREYLEWRRVELVLPNGVHRRFAPPPPKPPPPEPPTPLCSEVPPDTLPCWVKPPAGYRTRR